MKKVAFNLVLSLPTLLLAYILTPFLINLYRFHHVDSDAVVKEMRQAVQNLESHPESFSRFHPGTEVGRPLIRSKNEKVIYVYGGSSIVLSNSGVYPHNVFSGKLQEALKGTALVSNFGRNGVDSLYERDIFEYTSKIQKPDLVIVYSGHNDYTNLYRHVVRPHYSLLKGTIFQSLVRARKRFAGHAEWNIDFNFEPMVDTYVAAVGLLPVNSSEFLRYDSIAEGCFHDNIRRIADYAKANGIPVLLITPIGNLHKKPVGNAALLQEYERAVLIPDYGRRIAQLLEVRDRDFLAPDIRAKTPLLQFMRRMEDERHGIYVLDLEQELVKRKFEFDRDDVYDYLHLTQPTHEVIKDLILREIKEKALLGRRRK